MVGIAAMSDDANHTDHEPWLRYRDTGLFVVPSIHYRQVFAQLVFEACQRIPFDVIAIELPPSSREGVLRAVAELPTPSVIISPVASCNWLAEVPISADEDAPIEKRNVRRGVFLPVTTTDSLIAAARAPLLLKDHHPNWHPEIVFIDDEYEEDERARERLPMRDDYEVHVSGLQAFFDRIGEQWEATRDEQVDHYRERVMTGHLRRYLDQGKRILFVCGAAHWNRIHDLLDSGEETVETGYTPEYTQFDGEVHGYLEPSLSWLFGWLDDIPFVDWQQEQGFQNLATRYDKRLAVDRLLAQACASMPQSSRPSLRKLKKLSEYLNSRLVAEGRWVPRLDGHLIDAAEACVHAKFAEALKQQSLHYPVEPPGDNQWSGVRALGDNTYLAYVKDDIFVLQFPRGTSPGTDSRCLPQAPQLTNQEESDFETEYYKGRRDWPYDQLLLYQMDSAAREKANQSIKQRFSRKFTGSFEAGMDWRRTIRARSRGDKSALFVTHEKTIRRICYKPDDLPVTPVVWVFERGVPTEYVSFKIGWISEGDPGVTAIGFVSKREFLADNRIWGEKMSVFIDLGLSKAYLGNNKPDIFDGEAEKNADTGYLSSLPENKICTMDSFYKTKGFQGTELAIATAIRYCKNRVIIVANRGLSLSPKLLNFADDHEVEFSRVYLEDFEPEKVERFRWIYWVPCPGDDGYAQPYEWCDRFVPPI